ncbi:hypothetical protein JHK85_051297 [Glycine max]|nr:hypothetical protein JHK86_050438 [Glycine max]KAG4936378.1 hypothetical protein JHK85_051297 [Glycine max]
METIHETDYEYNPYAKEFGINIDSKLVSVEARYVELASEVCHRRGKIPVASEVAEMLVQMGKSTACYIGVLDRCKLEQDGRDICKWKQDRSGCFSVKSTYEALHDFRMGDNANDLLLKFSAKLHKKFKINSNNHPKTVTNKNTIMQQHHNSKKSVNARTKSLNSFKGNEPLT